MSDYVYTTAGGIHFRHTVEPTSVTVLNDRMEPLGASIEPADEEYDTAVSLVSNRLVVGYWAEDLSVFDLMSGESLRQIPLRKVGPLAQFDRTGRRLLLKSGARVRLVDIDDGTEVAIAGVKALDAHVHVPERDLVIVPSLNKDEILELSLETGAATVQPVAFGATLFDLKLSPNADQLMAIDRRKRVHCLDRDYSILWTRSLATELGRDHMAVGQFCGDGTLFAAEIAATDRNYTLVLDVQTGEVVRECDAVCDVLPYRGTRVRDAATQPGTLDVETFDLATEQWATLTLPD